MKNREIEVWAEVGSNWKRETPAKSNLAALAHIIEAAECGADVVKFQLFTADGLFSRDRAPAKYKAVQPYELPVEWLPDMKAKAVVNGVKLWVSVFEPGLVDIALEHADGIKLASGDFTYRPLVEAVARAERLCISTGAGLVYSGLVQGLNWLYDAGFTGDLILMVCVSEYPAAKKHYNLELWDSKVAELGCRKGLSDHTTGPNWWDYCDVARLAASRSDPGYDVTEKHFALISTPQDSPDLVHSLSPHEFKVYVRKVKEVAQHLRGASRAKVEEFEVEEHYWMRRGTDGLRPQD